MADEEIGGGPVGDPGTGSTEGAGGMAGTTGGGSAEALGGTTSAGGGGSGVGGGEAEGRKSGVGDWHPADSGGEVY